MALKRTSKNTFKNKSGGRFAKVEGPDGHYLAEIFKDLELMQITITDSEGQKTTFPYGGSPGTVYWSLLPMSESDGTKIVDYLSKNYYNKTEVDQKLDLEASRRAAIQTDLNTHKENSNIHVNAADKTNWNGKSKVEVSVDEHEDVDTIASLSLNGTWHNLPKGGTGSTKYYIHTVSFNTTTSPEIHFQVGVISKSASRYSNFDEFWADREKIVTMFGTPNMISDSLYFNGAMADQYSIKARGVKIEDGQFSTDVIDIGYGDIDTRSFGDYGVKEL